jgi:hypothetical protein
MVSQFNSPTSTEQTSGWKTYVNEKYGFGIKYPATWVVSSEKRAITGETSVVISGKPDTVSISFDVNKNANTFNPGHNLTIGDVLSHRISRIQSSYATLAGRKALVQSSASTGCYEDTVYVPQASSTEVFLIIDHAWCIDVSQSALESQLASNLEAHNSLFEQILSTFKFVPSVAQIEGWNTYNNTKFNYSIKYPSNFTIAFQELSVPPDQSTAFNLGNFKFQFPIRNLKPGQMIISVSANDSSACHVPAVNSLDKQGVANVDGVEALKYILHPNDNGDLVGTYGYLFQKTYTDTCFSIKFLPYPSDTSTLQKFDQVVSTFKFGS